MAVFDLPPLAQPCKLEFARESQKLDNLCCPVPPKKLLAVTVSEPFPPFFSPSQASYSLKKSPQVHYALLNNCPIVRVVERNPCHFSKTPIFSFAFPLQKNGPEFRFFTLFTSPPTFLWDPLLFRSLSLAGSPPEARGAQKKARVSKSKAGCAFVLARSNHHCASSNPPLLSFSSHNPK